MHTLKLSYFDFDGGRGEPARLIMALGKLAFEDDRIPLASWPDVKSQTPFHALPILEVDGKVLTQSNAINRFLGTLTNLYPSDPWQAALCDEVMDAVDDVVQKVVQTFFLADDEKKTAREDLVSGPIPLYLTRLQERLEANGGHYFADNRLTVADLKVFVWIQGLLKGHLDHIPTDLAERTAPLLIEHMERISDQPAIKEYYANRI